ncbi:Wzz/FepE/Etk N-terminal domain-containing protein [Methylobacterium tardum]|uniref:Wzz/FepE/Etk N-terminal domain-containing protein n=1 Tax=Methylobacterium tardum TaxID=374432 RepID=UPI00361B4BB4
MFDFSTRMGGDQPVRMVLPQVTPRTEPRVILRRLWRGSGFIVLGALFMVAVAVALLGLITPRYTSSMQVLVDPSDLRVVENDVNARQPQADSGVSIAESRCGSSSPTTCCAGSSPSCTSIRMTSSCCRTATTPP